MIFIGQIRDYVAILIELMIIGYVCEVVLTGW